MPARAHIRSVVAVLLAMLVTARAGAALPPAATDDTWREVSTARFRVYSDASEVEAVHAARHLERLADAMERVETGLSVDSTRLVRVYVFRDANSFKPYLGSSGDDYSATAGYAATGCDADYIAFFLAPGQPAMNYAAHEYTHTVMSRTLGQLPIWVNEGLAEYFSTFESQSKRAMIGRSPPGRTGWLRDHLLPLEFLLQIDYNSPEYTRGPNRATLYAESWALVHMLIFDDATGPSRFDALVQRLVAGTPSVDALRQIYGPGAVDSLEDQLRRFSRQPAVSYVSYTFDTEFDEVPARARVLDRAETRLVLGELLAHADESLLPAAGEHLQAAWAEDSSRVRTAAELGELAERQGRLADADRWFEAVARATTAEPRAAGIAGHALALRCARRKQGFGWPAPGADANALLARTLSARALEVEPDNDTWLADYGMTFLDDSADVSRGVGALIQAHQRSPRRCDVGGAQSVLALRAGNRGAAVALYQRIPAGGDRTYWRSQAGRLIALATRDEVLSLARSGAAAEAESLVARLRREVLEAGVASLCDDLERFIRQRQSAQSEPAAAGASARRAARAPTARRAEQAGAPAADDPLAPGLTAMNAGDYAGAEMAFERVVRQTRSSTVRARAATLSARARDLRRIDTATDLLSRGSRRDACAFLDLVLAESSAPDLKRKAAQLKAKSCGATGP